jgi:hypothetical protein
MTSSFSDWGIRSPSLRLAATRMLSNTVRCCAYTFYS